MLSKVLKTIASECSVMDGVSSTTTSNCLKAQETLDKRRDEKNVRAVKWGQTM